MRYKIELRYAFRWDDAEWTEEAHGRTRPLRFRTIQQAQQALDEFFAGVRAAVSTGNMDTEAAASDYRIVPATRKVTR